MTRRSLFRFLGAFLVAAALGGCVYHDHGRGYGHDGGRHGGARHWSDGSRGGHHDGCGDHGGRRR